MLFSYVPIAILLLLVTGFAALVLFVTSYMGPRGTLPGAEDPYESGIVPESSERKRFPVRFALVAMLFLVFDVEAVFFYPWAVSFKLLGLFGLGEMLTFMAVLFLGYLYAYKKGALEWE